MNALFGDFCAALQSAFAGQARTFLCSDRLKQAFSIAACDRMGPGESRLEFIDANWQPLPIGYALEMFSQVSPLPNLLFKKYDPSQMPVDDVQVLHLHPPAALRFNAMAQDRVVHLEYGILPEIWLKNRDTDGVRFRAYLRGPDHRSRLAWTHFVQPIQNESDRGTLTTEIALPAHHTFELQIDAGPDHNPGYDWSYIAALRILDSK